jgi:hypothetical protein
MRIKHTLGNREDAVRCNDHRDAESAPPTPETKHLHTAQSTFVVAVIGIASGQCEVLCTIVL